MAAKAPTVVYMEVVKDGPSRVRMSENDLNPESPPVIDGMYLHKYVIAKYGHNIKVTIESAE